MKVLAALLAALMIPFSVAACGRSTAPPPAEVEDCDAEDMATGDSDCWFVDSDGHKKKKTTTKKPTASKAPTATKAPSTQKRSSGSTGSKRK